MYRTERQTSYNTELKGQKKLQKLAYNALALSRLSAFQRPQATEEEENKKSSQGSSRKFADSGDNKRLTEGDDWLTKKKQPALGK